VLFGLVVCLLLPLGSALALCGRGAYPPELNPPLECGWPLGSLAMTPLRQRLIHDLQRRNYSPWASSQLHEPSRR
jgi:hypothetical protein